MMQSAIAYRIGVRRVCASWKWQQRLVGPGEEKIHPGPTGPGGKTVAAERYLNERALHYAKVVVAEKLKKMAAMRAEGSRLAVWTKKEEVTMTALHDQSAGREHLE